MSYLMSIIHARIYMGHAIEAGVAESSTIVGSQYQLVLVDLVLKSEILAINFSKVTTLIESVPKYGKFMNYRHCEHI